MTQAVKDRPSVWRKPPEMPSIHFWVVDDAFRRLKWDGHKWVYQYLHDDDHGEPERWAYVSDLLEC